MNKLMKITSHVPMADILHHNYLLLPILYRFDIPLGVGDKSIKTVCEENGANVDFFIEIVNSFGNPDYFPKDTLQLFPASVIVDYLKKTHTYYLDIKVPQVERQIQELLSNCKPANRKNLELVQQFFNGYRNELSNHIQREEDRVLPYILEIEDALQKQKVSEALLKKIRTYSIDDFADEHDNVEDKLFDLKNIIIRYLPPVQNRVLCQDMLMDIFRLERDLNDHSRIEDKVLVPKVRSMEREVLKMKQG
ncbi:MAG: hypothetical protein ACOC0C_09220 [Bacteroidota bacterium]